MKISITRRFIGIRAWSAVTFLAAALVSQAAEETPKEGKNYLPWEKGSVKVGGFVAAFNSELAFSLDRAAGVTFDAEDLFGLDTSLWVFRAEAMYRPGKSLRNQIDFSYAGYHRDGHGDLSRPVEINGVTYPAGSHVESTFNFDIIRGTYSYALLQDERMRVAIGLGVYAVPLKYGLSIQNSSGNSAVEGANTTLPLPALALQGEFQLVPKLFLNAAVDAMYLELSDFKGSLLDVNIGLEYRPWKHVGFGLGYNALSVEVTSNSSSSSYPGIDFAGDVGVRFNGLMLYGKFSF